MYTYKVLCNVESVSETVSKYLLCAIIVVVSSGAGISKYYCDKYLFCYSWDLIKSE